MEAPSPASVGEGGGGGFVEGGRRLLRHLGGRRSGVLHLAKRTAGAGGDGRTKKLREVEEVVEEYSEEEEEEGEDSEEARASR